MRELWDQEQPLSPAMLRAGLGVFNWIVAAWAALNVLGGLGLLFSGKFFAALTQLLSGVAVPFAIWFALRILVDLLIVQNRLAARLEQQTRSADPKEPPAGEAGDA